MTHPGIGNVTSPSVAAVCINVATCAFQLIENQTVSPGISSALACVGMCSFLSNRVESNVLNMPSGLGTHAYSTRFCIA